MTITHESIRAAGGKVHADGNIFFTSLEQLRAALAAASPAGQQPVAHARRIDLTRRYVHEKSMLVSFTAEGDWNVPLFAAPDVAAIGEGVELAGWQERHRVHQGEWSTWREVEAQDLAYRRRHARDNPHYNEIRQVFAALAQQAAQAGGDDHAN